MKRLLFILISILVITSVVSAKLPIYYPISTTNGSGNTTINYYGTMNQTPGEKGDTGAQGIQGINGTPGIQGIQGIPGETGATGSQGIQGLQGDQGIPGLNNMTQGIQGLQGLQGVNGTPGVQGINGTPGEQGIQGINGTPGEQGIQGINGTPGEQGINGTPGSQGIPGEIPDVTQFLFINGTRPMTGTLDMGSWFITNLITGTLGTQATNKTYVDSVNSSMKNYVDSKPSGITDVSWNITYLLNTVGSSWIQTNRTAIEQQMATNQTEVWNNKTWETVANVSSYVISVNTSMRNNVSANFIPMINNKTPPINLGSGTADTTTYLRGDQTWATPSGGSDPTSKSTTLIHSDLYEAGVATAIPGLTGLAISSGTAAVVATTNNHPGVIYMRDSTTANGGYKYGCIGTQLLGGGETYEVVFQPVGVRANQNSKMGWADTAAAMTLPVDGVFFNISGTGAAISLRGNTSSNSARSGTLTAFAPTTATWYRGTITLNSGATLATFTIFNEAGVQQWTDTVATNIPTGAGRDTSPCIIVAESTTDAAADILRLDYVRWGTTRTLVR